MGGGNNEQVDAQPALERIPAPDPYGPGWSFQRALHSAGEYIPEGAKWLGNEVRQGILPDEALAEIQKDPTSLKSLLSYAESGLALGTTLSGGGGKRLSMGERIPAGEGFMWNAKPIEDIQGLPKSGVMPESRFAKAGSEAGAFSNDELALMKQLVPDAFTETGVNVPRLHEGLAESGPVVEVKKLGTVAVTPQGRRIAEIRHQLDTELPQWRGARWNATPEQMRLINEHASLVDAATSNENFSSAEYAFVGPKPENQMPGYVEGLVRLPHGIDINKPGSANEMQALEAQGGIKYRGPHFGAEDTNVLSSYRGYEETLPSGEKAFHVIEVQSDWGQNVRKESEFVKENPATELTYPPHPLLEHYEALGLKAAIQHAKEIGATKVILPDAETAMMTEGHDRAAVAGGRAHTPEEGFIEPKITQEGGMRLHYDETLPSAMRKLTGDKGEPIDLGTHKGVQELREHNQQITNRNTGEVKEVSDLTVDQLNKLMESGDWVGGMNEKIGSPVFKDSSGNPKTSITGKIYDISKTPDQFKLMKAGRITDSPYWNT